MVYLLAHKKAWFWLCKKSAACVFEFNSLNKKTFYILLLRRLCR